MRSYYSTDVDRLLLKLKKKIKTIYHFIKYIMKGQVVSGETIVPFAVFLHNDCGFRPTGCTCRALYWPKTQPRWVVSVITITAIIIITTNIIVIIIIILIVAVVCVYNIIILYVSCWVGDKLFILLYYRRRYNIINSPNYVQALSDELIYMTMWPTMQCVQCLYYNTLHTSSVEFDWRSRGRWQKTRMMCT